MSNHGRREQVFGGSETVHGGMRQNGLTARRQFTRLLIDKQGSILFREKKSGAYTRIPDLYPGADLCSTLN